jgi:uncharacterized protein YndB with AHSA1/START domain
MIEPLRMELTVECSVEHAFETWASQTSRWWPSDHTVTGERGLTVTFEGRTGGRIFERTSSGAEHDWGEVLVWDPPHRLTYRWHIVRDRGHATEVDISFARVAEATPSSSSTAAGSGWVLPAPRCRSATGAVGAACCRTSRVPLPAPLRSVAARGRSATR